MADHRWPLAPLLEATGHNLRSLSDALNVSRSRVSEASRDGISDLVADRWACRLGLHPALVWTSWFETALTELDREFVWGSERAEPGWRQAALWRTKTVKNTGRPSPFVAPLASTMGVTTRDEPGGAANAPGSGRHLQRRSRHG